MPYNPSNWYWFVGGNTAQVWSSSAAAYVPASNTAFEQWCAAGNLATNIDSESDLQKVLAVQYPSGWPLTTAQLATNALSAGLTITSASTPALNGTYACDPVSQADIVAIETSLNAGKGFPGGTTTFNYPDMAGAMHAFTQANFTNFAAAIRDYVYGLKSAIAGVSSSLPAATAAIA